MARKSTPRWLGKRWGFAHQGVVLALVVAWAAQAADVPTVATTATKLHAPSGIAVQPETGDVYVAESGLGRIIRVSSDGPIEVVTGFSKGTPAATGSPLPAGPRGIVFANRNELLVAEGGSSAQGIRLLKLPETPGQPPLAAESGTWLPIPASSSAIDSAGSVGLWHLLILRNRIIASGARPNDAWAWHSELRSAPPSDSDLTLAPWEKFLPATRTQTSGDAIACAINARGESLLLGPGRWDQVEDSELTIVRTTDGESLAHYRLNGANLIALAFGPPNPKTTRSQLYGLDFGQSPEHPGALVRLESVLVDRRPSVRCVRLVELAQPTAMAFATDGTLWVTLLGADPSAATGQVVGITGLF